MARSKSKQKRERMKLRIRRTKRLKVLKARVIEAKKAAGKGGR